MKIKAVKYGFGRKGLEINNNTMYCLCSRDYKNPKMVLIDDSNITQNNENPIGGGILK